MVVRLCVNVRPAHLRRPGHPIGCPCGEARSNESVQQSSWPRGRACCPRCRVCSQACSVGRPTARTTRAARQEPRASVRCRYNPPPKAVRTRSRLHRPTQRRATVSPRRPGPGEGSHEGEVKVYRSDGSLQELPVHEVVGAESAEPGVKPRVVMSDGGRGESTVWCSVSPPVAHGVNAGSVGSIPSRMQVGQLRPETLGLFPFSRRLRASKPGACPSARPT